MKENYYHEEEDFHGRDRKQFRKERRHAQETDRSKFKKSDVDQEKKESIPLDDPNLLQGRVLAITGEGVLIDVDGESFLCTLKGLMKKEKMQAKNLIAVGDLVRLLPTHAKEGTIVHIEDRYSILSRQDISGQKEQIMAVNIDQLIIIASIDLPPLKPALIDRYLIAAEIGHMHPVIIVNKIDRLETAAKEERELYHQFLIAYETLGYPILSVSAFSGIGMDNFRSIMKNKASVIAGQSGVGKSSLLNTAFGFALKTGLLAQKTFKGSHTTTTAQLLRLSDGGFCIDTPGIRGFSLWNLDGNDLMNHFREFIPFSKECRYPDCTHLNEPSCRVMEAVQQGHIAPIRYESYKSLKEELIAGVDNRTKRKTESS